MGCLLCVLKWYNGFIFIIQLLYYHYFLILFRATHMNSYHYYFVAAMHHYTFLLDLGLQSNTMCQQNMSHEAEVLCSDVCLQKESHSIDVQVHTLRSDQTAAPVRRYYTTSPSLVLHLSTLEGKPFYRRAGMLQSDQSASSVRRYYTKSLSLVLHLCILDHRIPNLTRN